MSQRAFSLCYQFMKQPAIDPFPKEAPFEFITAHSHHLSCKLCTQLMQQPIRLHRCGHTFCMACIQPKAIKKCPLCLQKIEDKQKDLLASRLVGELTVRCLNEGCPWKGSFEEFKNFHQKSCRLKAGGIDGWLKELQNAIGQKGTTYKKDEESHPEKGQQNEDKNEKPEVGDNLQKGLLQKQLKKIQE